MNRLAQFVRTPIDILTGRSIPGSLDEVLDFVRVRLLEDEAEGWAWGDSLNGATHRLDVEVRRLGAALAAAFRLKPFLCMMATRYADHPDFREEWRP